MYYYVKLINLTKEEYSMNIVYLIGNGFDLNLGMRTRYEDFYKDYLSRSENDSAIVRDFIDFVKGRKEAGNENWSDMESALGEYFVKIKTAPMAIELYNHLKYSLSEYITNEEEMYKFDKDQKNVFFEYLKNPYLCNGILPKERTEIYKYIYMLSSENWSIRLMTFNYTRTIENILGNSFSESPIQIGTHQTGGVIELSGIEHIHGFTKERMIFGVNDVSQIANDELKGVEEITNRYVKSDCNAICGLEHNEKCESWIRNANLICLFGLSFGKTDKKWWELIGETLKRPDCIVLLFGYGGKKFDGNQHVELYEAKKAIKDNFLSQTNLNENVKKVFKKKIFVAYNTDMFKLDIGERIEKQHCVLSSKDINSLAKNASRAYATMIGPVSEQLRSVVEQSKKWPKMPDGLYTDWNNQANAGNRNAGLPDESL